MFTLQDMWVHAFLPPSAASEVLQLSFFCRIQTMSKSCVSIWVSKMTGDYDRYLAETKDQMEKTREALSKLKTGELNVVRPLKSYRKSYTVNSGYEALLAIFKRWCQVPRHQLPQNQLPTKSTPTTSTFQEVNSNKNCMTETKPMLTLCGVERSST